MKFWIIFFILVSVGACAMEMPKGEFMDLSKLIVVAKVDSVGSWTEPMPGMLVYDFNVKIEETFRGQASDTIAVKSCGNVTETPELELGKRYVMFLQWSDELEAYLFVNGVQGCWEVYEDGTLGGMGRGRPLKKLREHFQNHP